MSMLVSRWRRDLTGAFVLFHLGVILAWNGVPGGALGGELRVLLAPYVHLVGLWQSWNMFAPTPISEDVLVEARMRHRDGASATWRFPRLSEAGMLARYGMERQRKWVENLGRSRDPEACAMAARWVARRHDRPGNPVVWVELVRRAKPLPPPPGHVDAATGTSGATPAGPAGWREHRLYETSLPAGPRP